jgi:hypothetical protein
LLRGSDAGRSSAEVIAKGQSKHGFESRFIIIIIIIIIINIPSSGGGGGSCCTASGHLMMMSHNVIS